MQEERGQAAKTGSSPVMLNRAQRNPVTVDSQLTVTVRCKRNEGRPQDRQQPSDAEQGRHAAAAEPRCITAHGPMTVEHRRLQFDAMPGSRWGWWGGRLKVQRRRTKPPQPHVRAAAVPRSIAAKHMRATARCFLHRGWRGHPQQGQGHICA